MRRLVFAAAATLLLSTHAHALGPTDDRVPSELTKFQRGVANAVFGLPAEIVGRAIVSAHSEAGLQSGTSFVGHFVMGGVYGLGWGVVRVGAGLVDVFTFPVMLNDDNGPIVDLDPADPF